jgi:hypothetical protein
MTSLGCAAPETHPEAHALVDPLLSDFAVGRGAGAAGGLISRVPCLVLADGRGRTSREREQAKDVAGPVTYPFRPSEG